MLNFKGKATSKVHLDTHNKDLNLTQAGYKANKNDNQGTDTASINLKTHNNDQTLTWDNHQDIQEAGTSNIQFITYKNEQTINWDDEKANKYDTQGKNNLNIQNNCQDFKDINEEIKLSFQIKQKNGDKASKMKRQQILNSSRTKEQFQKEIQKIQKLGIFENKYKTEMYGQFCQLNQLQDIEKDKKVELLISALTSQCSPEFFALASNDLNECFQNEDVNTNISMKNIYSFIEIILKTQFLEISKATFTEYLLQIQNGKENEISTILQSYLTGCLQILSGISRGTDAHCAYFDNHGLHQLLFDIYDAKKGGVISEDILYIIGNIIAARDTLKQFFMQLNFHQKLFECFNQGFKHKENLLMNQRICRCLSILTSYYLSFQNNNSTQLTIKQNPFKFCFDFSKIFETFIQNQDLKISTYISQIILQLITIFYNEKKRHPSFDDKQSLTATLNLQMNLLNKNNELMIIKEEVDLQIEQNLQKYLNKVLKMNDFTIVIQTLRFLSSLMDNYEKQLQILKPAAINFLQSNINNQAQIIRIEVVNTMDSIVKHYLKHKKPKWIQSIISIIFQEFQNQQQVIQQKMYKIIDKIIDQSDIIQITKLMIKPKVIGIFQLISKSLSNFQTNTETKILVINILKKIIQISSNNQSQIIQLIDQEGILKQIDKLQEEQNEEIILASTEFAQFLTTTLAILDEQKHKKTEQNITFEYQEIQQLNIKLNNTDI